MEQFSDNSLWLHFRLDSMDFCMLSDNIESIIIPDKIEPIPDAPLFIAGVTTYGKNQITVVEMRELFGRMNLIKYVEQFSIMQELHVSWVQDLDKFVHGGGTFNKTLDPHKCKFGVWYDNFTTDNLRLQRLLTKISSPHERIHKCGEEIMQIMDSDPENHEAIEAKLAEAMSVCHEDMLPLLDRLISIYRSANRGVILAMNMNGLHFGLLVDSVRALIPCKKTERRPLSDKIYRSQYIRGAVFNGDKIMLEVDAGVIQQVNLAQTK